MEIFILKWIIDDYDIVVADNLNEAQQILKSELGRINNLVEDHINDSDNWSNHNIEKGKLNLR